MNPPFSVNWSDEALDQLAELWMAAADCANVNAAVAAIDASLADEPQLKGTEVAEDLYRLQFGHFRAYFQIDGGRRAVEIVAVKLIPDPRLN